MLHSADKNREGVSFLNRVVRAGLNKKVPCVKGLKKWESQTLGYPWEKSGGKRNTKCKGLEWAHSEQQGEAKSGEEGAKKYKIK